MIGRSIQTQWPRSSDNLLIPVSKAECDSLNQEWLDAVIHKYQPERIIALQGYNGNITLNLTEPATIYFQTVRMLMNVMESSMLNKVQKVLIPISSCAYDGYTELLKEENFLDGKCHESVIAHGMARRGVYVYGQCLNKQFGKKSCKFIFPVLNNCFGPHDRFLEPKRLKIFGTLIKRIIDAKRQNLSEIEVWGTGEARREGLGADCAGKLLIDVLDRYEDYSLPINLGLGYDISIYELTCLIRKLVGFKGRVFYNSSKPNGQMKKLLDVSKAKSMGFTPKQSLEEALAYTIKWYQQTYPEGI